MRYAFSPRKKERLFPHQRKSLSISLVLDYFAIISKRQRQNNFDWKSVNLSQKEMGTPRHTQVHTVGSIDRSISW